MAVVGLFRSSSVLLLVPQVLHLVPQGLDLVLHLEHDRDHGLRRVNLARLVRVVLVEVLLVGLRMRWLPLLLLSQLHLEHLVLGPHRLRQELLDPVLLGLQVRSLPEVQVLALLHHLLQH